MRIKLLTLTAALMVGAGVSAQEPFYGTFDEPQHEVAISYGLYPVTDFMDMYPDLFGELVETGNRTGTVSLSYIYKLSEIVGVGGAFAFAGYGGNYIEPAGNPTYKNFFSLLPQAKFNWYAWRSLTLYSRAAAGVTLVDLREGNDVPANPEYDKTKAAFIWQLSPIGIEVGRTFAVYAEAGFGAIGTAMLGIRCRF